MIINITYFSWCDSHFQGLAKRGESSEQKCNTSVWSEAQTKVKLKILIPIYSKPKLRWIGHLLHNIFLLLQIDSKEAQRIIHVVSKAVIVIDDYCINCYIWCYIFPKKDQQKWRLKKKRKNFGMFPWAIYCNSLFKWSSSERQKNVSRKYLWTFLCH